MKEQYQRRNRRSFRNGLAVCAACMLFVLTGITGWAARTGTVQVDSVNVRSEASADSGRVCQLPRDTAVNIVEEAAGGDGNVWYSVTFTLDGAETAGWIRSDMLAVTETEGTEGEISTGGSAGYTIQEPIESYQASDALTQTTISVGESSFTAWQVSTELTGGQELYLVSAARADGSIGWFYYDPAEGTFQRDLGQFAEGGTEPEGLIEALQQELTDLKESSAKQLGTRLYIIIGLAVLCVVLLILVIVFGLKYRNAAYEYYDDYDDDDEDMEEEPAEKRRVFFRRHRDPDEDEDDEADDFFAEARRKLAEPDEEERDEEVDVPEEEEDAKASTGELPEIDLSAVLEVEKSAEKEQPRQTPKAETKEQPVVQQAVQEETQEADGLDDFDIEILDWEDLGL